MITVMHTLRLGLQTYLEFDAERSRRLRHPVLRRARHVRWLLWLSFAALAVFALFAPPARAAFALFDPLVNQVQGDSVNWFTSIQGLVRPTFLLLGTIEICWAAAIWAFEKDSLNSLSIEIIKKIMFHGFFYAVLLYAQDWIPAITDSFQAAGEHATGAPTISTDKIIEMGLDIIGTIWAQTIAFVFPIIAVDPEEYFGTANPVAYAALALGEAQYMLTAVTTIMVALAYVIVAAQYFTLKLESYVLFAAGAIFLGMGSNGFTKEYVSKYLNYAINVGVRLLVLILILSITLDAVSKMGSVFAFDYKALLGVMAASALQAILAIKAPDMAGALLSGSPGLTAGGVFNTVLNTAAQFRLASGGAAGAGRAAANGSGNNGGGQGGGQGGHGPGATGPSSLRNAVSAGHNPMSPPPDRSGVSHVVEGLGGRLAREMNSGSAPPSQEPSTPQSRGPSMSANPASHAERNGRPRSLSLGDAPLTATPLAHGGLESTVLRESSAADLALSSTSVPPATPVAPSVTTPSTGSQAPADPQRPGSSQVPGSMAYLRSANAASTRRPSAGTSGPLRSATATRSTLSPDPLPPPEIPRDAPRAPPDDLPT